MIKELGITPGPRMGWILHALLEEVLDAPEKNTVEHLSELVKSLNMLGDAELKTLGLRGKEKKEELEEEEVKKEDKIVVVPEASSSGVDSSKYCKGFDYVCTMVL